MKGNPEERAVALGEYILETGQHRPRRGQGFRHLQIDRT